MAQERRVLLANGQYITIVQTTGTSSGDVMSQSAVTAALNAKANVSHTHSTSDITSGTFATARIADGAITTAKLHDKSVTLAKLADDVPISTTSYEIVKVSGLTSDGTATVGAEVMIGGAVYKFDSTGVVSAPIPYGQAYKIQAYSNDAWVGSYEATFTANTSSRSISITYNGVSNGVFIEATDGILYTSSNWASNKAANSIVVVSDNARFRMALTQPSESMWIGNDEYDPFDSHMTAISDSTIAKADYNGVGNTVNILKINSNTSRAAGYCNAFTFPDGKTKGFLPSLGQLNLAYQNKSAVDTALSKCGGTAMTLGSYYYWSSTFQNGQYDSYRTFWRLSWTNGSIDTGNVRQPFSVRPFASY